MTSKSKKQQAGVNNPFQELEYLPMTAFVMRPESPFELIFINEFINTMTGIPASSFYHESAFIDHIDVQHRQSFVELVEHASEHESRIKIKFLFNDGNFYWVELIIHLDKLPDESESVVFGILNNIDNDMRAYQLLKYQEEIFRISSQCSNDLVYEKDINTGTLIWYADIDNALGYEQGEFPRTIEAWENNIHPNDLDRVKQAIAKHLEQPEEVFDQEYLIRTKDGKYKIWIDHGQLMPGDEILPRRIIGSCSDITKSKQEYLQIQKMETVGRLAGGIAHDFNNLLTAIIGFSDMAMEQDNLDEKSRSYINEIKNAGELAASLTRQLLAFSRKQVLTIQKLNLNEVVKNTEKLVRRLTGEKIEIQVNLASSLQLAEFDSSQIQQVIMNLSVNARDAMPAGGILKISTSNISLDETITVDSPEIIPGNYVCLKIGDSGEGISKEDLSRIFEPFFTTKSKGKGTGLGLSTVYGIIKQSKGYIYANSVPGKGTEFCIYLPAINETAEQIIEEPKQQIQETGNECILLVEDEPMVRTLTVAALKRNGYTILIASSAEEALTVFEENKERVNLLLTDVIMPGMNGMELAQKLTRQNPEMKIIFMSGYSDDVFANTIQNLKDFCLIEKPFTPDQLTALVREKLDD